VFGWALNNLGVLNEVVGNHQDGVLRPYCTGALFTGCSFAPLIKSHNINATSPSMAGKAILKAISLYCGNSKTRKAQDQQGEAIDDQPDAQKARKEVRPVDKDPQREQPQAPE